MAIDTFSKAGAERLARTVMRKWAQRGEAVSAWVEAFPGKDKNGDPIDFYAVRSNLVNGLPVKPALQRAA